MHVKMVYVPVEPLSCKIDHRLNPWFDHGIWHVVILGHLVWCRKLFNAKGP